MRKFRADPLIFFTAVGFIIAFVALTIGFGDSARELYSNVSGWMMDNFAWLYIGGVSTVFIFLIVLFVSKYGNYRLGDDDDEPEYSLPVWFSMLFAAGMGATLLFWGAAEPLHHAYNPPRGGYESMSRDAIRQAFEFTYYHFGIHMWVIFTLPGLAMGYFIYKRKMPAVTRRSSRRCWARRCTSGRASFSTPSASSAPSSASPSPLAWACCRSVPA